MQELDLDVATEFLLIAATLVELKARRLLPGKENVDLDDDLALWEERDMLLARLLECKTFKDVARILSRYVDDADRTYGRLAGPEEHFAAMSPDPLEGISIAKLQAGFVRAITPRAELSLDLFHVSPIRFTVAEAVNGLMTSLPSLGGMTFRQMVRDLVERLDIIVHFLAILEMYKQGYVEIDQTDKLGDIHVEWTGRGPELGDEAMQIDDYEG